MNNKKSLIALALVALVGIVGGTFAYFTSSTTLNNEFVTGTYSTSVKEEFVSPSNWTPGTTTQKKVNVTNNGSVDVAVRASYTEKWLAADGTTALSGTRDGEQVAQFTIGSDWEESIDGYYYYKGTLTNGQTSSDFLSSVTFNPNFELKDGADIQCTTSTVDGVTTSSCTSLNTGYAGATYSLDITIETIQADKKWDYTPGHTYRVGEVVSIGNELFNVIKDNGDTVTMLAQYNLGSDYKQTETQGSVRFSSINGWVVGENIAIQNYEGGAKTYVNEYTAYLQGTAGDNTLSGTLITLDELKKLGCITSEDYSWVSGVTCESSIYSDWLINGQYYWTRTPMNATSIWYIYPNGQLYANYFNGASSLSNGYDENYGIRPVITISKDTLAN